MTELPPHSFVSRHSLDRWRPLGLFLAALAASLVLYWPALTAYFVVDELSILAHTHPRLGRDWSDCLRPMTNGFWRPVNLLLFRLHIAIFGLNPLGFHLTCLVIHSLSAMLTGLLAGRLVKNCVWAPAVACLLMVSMPAAFGPAVQLNQTNDSLLACCMLLALLLWDKWLEFPRARLLATLGGVLLFSIAVKESAFVIAGVMFLWALGRGRIQSRSVIVMGCAVLIFAIHAAVIFYVQTHDRETYSQRGQLISNASQFLTNEVDYVFTAFIPFPDLYQAEQSKQHMTPYVVSRLKAGFVFATIILVLTLFTHGGGLSDRLPHWA